MDLGKKCTKILKCLITENGRKTFVEGMVVAIEPMINLGTRNIKQHKDGWTITTADKNQVLI
jgi:methionine aminopeptidase